MKKIIFGYSLGPVGASLLGLLLVPLLSWIYYPAYVGRYAMIQVLLNLTVLIFSFGLDQSYIREYQQSEQRLDLFYLCYMPSVIALVLVILFFSIEGGGYQNLFDMPKSKFTPLFYLTMFLFLSIKFFSISVRMKQRAFIYSLVQIIPKLVLVISIFCVYAFFFASFESLIIIIFLSYLITVIFLLLVNKQEFFGLFRFYFDAKYFRKLFKFGFPLILGGIAYWGVIASDRFFIKHFNGLDEVAIYSVAASIAGVSAVFTGVFNTIWAPMVFQWEAEGRLTIEKVEKVLQGALGVVLLVISISGLFSWLLKYFLPDSYSDVVFLVPVLMVSPLLYTVAEVSSIGINLTRKTQYSLYATLVSLAVCLLLNYLFVPDFGALGAAVATMITFNIYLLTRTYFSDCIWKKLPKEKFYFPLLVLNGCVLSASVVDEFSYIIVLYGLLFLFALFYYKSMLLDFINLKNEERGKL